MSDFKAAPAGTVTFLFTDIEGSTRLVESLGDHYASVLAEQREAIFHAVRSHHGYEMGSEGDACFAAFARATDALAAALEAQLALLSHQWAPESEVRVRFGIHTGEARRTPAGYIGLAVHKGARIRSAAHGGQILLSGITRDLVAASLPPSAELKDLGQHRLKDLGQPERLFQVLHPGLEEEFPTPNTLDAFPNNLPVQLTSFIGRQREIEEVKRLLSSARLVTLVGPGGAGKTRLALQVAADVLDRFPEGAWLVDLAATTDGSVIHQTVASILGVRGSAPGVMGPRGVEGEEKGRSLIDKILDRLRTARALVVLDNCEHLISECADLSETILRSCPQITVFVTSREPLRVSGEARWRIPPLTVPETPEDVEKLDTFEAVRLFVDRAVLNQSDFALTAENAGAVVEITRRLDGMPLAIELAAAWVSALAPQQILSRLDDQFRLLASGPRRGPPRHQTLRATVDWSYDLLTEAERGLLENLSIFGGGFSLEAAERVCSEEGIEPHEVLHLLSRLVDKSLVIREEEGSSVRYRLLETIRQYGWEKVVTAPAAELPRKEVAASEDEATLRKQGDYWTIGYGSDRFRLKHSKGLDYLRLLVASPGREFHVLDLVVGADGISPDSVAARRSGVREADLSPAGDAGEVLDPRARSQYKARLAELERELDEARSWNDPERAAIAEEEIDFLARELASAEGLGGRARRAGSAAERARMSTSKAIKGAISKIEAESPPLGGHLKVTVHTGVFCSYRPDPTHRIRWDL